MAGLAKQNDVTRCVCLNCMRKVQSVEMWNRLEPGKLFGCAATGTNIFSVMKIKIRVVKLLAAFKLESFGFFWVRKIELDSQWVLVY